MAIEFYDIKLKKKVMIDEKDIVKVTFTTKRGLSYGIRGKTGDGRVLTKFVSKSNWEELKVPEEKK